MWFCLDENIADALICCNVGRGCALIFYDCIISFVLFPINNSNSSEINKGSNQFWRRLTKITANFSASGCQGGLILQFPVTVSAIPHSTKLYV